MWKKTTKRLLGLLLLLCLMSGCGSINTSEQEADKEVPQIAGHFFEKEISFDYASGVQIYRYQGGYSLICVKDGRQYLLIPQDMEKPDTISADWIVLRQPLDHIYMAATATASFFQAIDGVDTISMSSVEAKNWYVEEMRQRMEAGRITFAGKYSQPDYERLLQEHCSMALESTMILHAPEVMEKLQEAGIPVFVDYSSYEEHPLGRLEWVKVYGELLGKSQEAENFFEEQKQTVEKMERTSQEEKTVAFFYCNSSGGIVTRKTSDYMPKLISLAGGTYVFESLGEDNKASSSVNMTMEEFYAAAREADYIIYNGTIDEPLQSVEELIEKNVLFRDFRAVKEGQVYCTNESVYQATDKMAMICRDINRMLTQKDTDKMTFLYHVKERTEE